VARLVELVDVVGSDYKYLDVPFDGNSMKHFCHIVPLEI
jgi:hypothetical protein